VIYENNYFNVILLYILPFSIKINYFLNKLFVPIHKISSLSPNHTKKKKGASEKSTLFGVAFSFSCDSEKCDNFFPSIECLTGFRELEEEKTSPNHKMLGTCPIEKAASEKVHCLVFGVFSFLFPVTQKSVTIFSPLLDAQCIAGDSCIPDSWDDDISIWILNLRIELYLGDDTNLKEQGA
jgi:hypothetical protein